MKTKLNEDTRVKVAVYKPIFDKIAKAVGDQLNIDPKDIGRRDRHRGYVKARKLICYYMKHFTHCPIGVMGYMLNPKAPFDHANVHHMIKDYERLLSFKKPGGVFINQELRDESDMFMDMFKMQLPNTDAGMWLENFATSSGNFMIAEAV